MKVIKQDSEFGLRIFLLEDDKNLSITFGGNCDLYWSLHSKNESDKQSFVITKENYSVYRLFEKLFHNIETANIYDEDEIDYEYERNKLINSSSYKELFDKNNNTITWYSDETANEVANFLIIKKEEDSFKLDFFTQPHINGYDRDFNSPNYIPIRFRNSGSSYDPFNIAFVMMYRSMKEIDDSNEYGHQIHIEEYLYDKEKIKTLKK